MKLQTVRIAHRVVVDWVAETFHLPEDAARWHAEARARARTMAYDLNHHKTPNHRPNQGLADHAPREPRVLKEWQARIARLGRRGQA
jgi:hypothetical protein